MTYGTPGGTVGGLGVLDPEHGAFRPVTSQWQTILGPGGYGTPLSFFDSVHGSGMGLYIYNDTVFYIDGAGWSTVFYTDFIEFHAEGATSVQVQEGPFSGGMQLSSTIGSTFSFWFTGFNGALLFDPASNAVTVVLTEGNVDVELPIAQTFSATADTAVLLTVDADGSLDTQTISQAAAAAYFSPIFDSLTLYISMAEPLPESTGAQTDLAWRLLLDLDGSLATTSINSPAPIYQGIGTDMEIAARLNPDGTLQGWIAAGAPGLETPLKVTLSVDRHTVIVGVPLTVLARHAQVLGIPIAWEALRWRATATYVSQENDTYAADVVPEVTFPALPGGASGAAIPDGAQIKLSVTLSGDAPAAFSGEASSLDPDNPVTGWLWDFGDGTTSTEQNPTHAYAAAGEFTVTLTVMFANGAALPTQTTISITTPQPAAEPPAVSGPAEACAAVVNSGANLRGGPGTGFAVVGAVAAGESATVTGTNAAGDWIQLRRADGSAAWIASFLLSTPECPEDVTLPVVE